MLEQCGVQLVKPVLNDFQFYENFFCLKFEKEIDANLKLFEQKFDCFLRLVGIKGQSRELQLVVLNQMCRVYYDGIELANIIQVVK